MSFLGLSALIVAGYVSYNTYIRLYKKPNSSKKSRLSELNKNDWLVLLMDVKYHLLKLVLVRSVYHNYLKEQCLIGDQMLNCWTEV